MSVGLRQSNPKTYYSRERRVRPISRQCVIAHVEEHFREGCLNQRWYREVYSSSVPASRDRGLLFYFRNPGRRR